MPFCISRTTMKMVIPFGTVFWSESYLLVGPVPFLSNLYTIVWTNPSLFGRNLILLHINSVPTLGHKKFEGNFIVLPILFYTKRSRICQFYILKSGYGSDPKGPGWIRQDLDLLFAEVVSIRVFITK
jgi:hypothetical protein